MADFCDIQGMVTKAGMGLANRWFQPLTHVSARGFPRVSAVYVKRGIRRKREGHRFAVAQCAAQSVPQAFSPHPDILAEIERLAQ